MKNQFKTTAVHNGDHYHHFGIYPATASLYGDKIEDIEEVTLTVSDDQSPDNSMDVDYWGWYDNKKGEFTNMIYPKYFLLNMCFPYGIKATEETGQGKAYRLEINK